MEPKNLESSVDPNREISVFNPRLHRCEDVVYLPGFDCLYTVDGNRVDPSAHWRNQVPHGNSPTATAIPRDDLLEIDEPVVFAGHMPKRHFGHFILEAMSRLWVYPAEGLRSVPFAHYRTKFEEYEHKLLGAVLTPHDSKLLELNQPTLLRQALIPDQGILLYSALEFSKVMLPVYDLARETLVGEPTQRASQAPMFLSRSRMPRRFRQTLGQAALEARLRRRGIEIVHPETMAIEAQLRRIAAAETVISLHGSALHQTIFRNLTEARTISLGTCNPHPNQARIDRLRASEHLHLFVQFPMHPRLPAQLGGHTLKIGPYRNFLVPSHAEKRLLNVL